VSVRLRFAAAGVMAAVVLVGGLRVRGDVEAGPTTEPHPAAADVTGAWVCPHGGGDGWHAWVTVANPTDREALIRLTGLGPEGPADRQEAALAPGTAATIEVPAGQMAAATRVEFFGAPVAAGMVVARPDGGGTGAEPCAARPARRLRLADGTTVRGERTFVVLANPTAVDAVVDLTLVTEERVVRPGPLRGLLLPPGRTEAVDLGRSVLGERTVSVQVEARLGRVSASLIGLRDARGLRLSLASTAASRDRYLPGGADDGTAKVVVLAGRSEAPFRVRVQGLTAQEETLEEAAVAAGRTATFEVEASDASLVVAAEGAATLTAARRSGRADVGDQASTAGATETAEGWVIPPVLGSGGGDQFLVLQNPGQEAVTATLTLLGRDGPLPGPGGGTVTVDGGRARVVPLADGAPPVAAVVRSEGGSLVAAQVGVIPGGYTVAVGSRLGSFGPVDAGVSS